VSVTPAVLPPTVDDLKSWSRVDFSSLDDPFTDDDLQNLLNRTCAYLTSVTGRPMDSTMPTNLVPIAQDAIQLRVLMRLDDDEFWRWPTTCGDRVWFSPTVRGIVSEQRDAGYLERGGPDPTSVWTQHGTLELIEFVSGTS